MLELKDSRRVIIARGAVGFDVRIEESRHMMANLKSAPLARIWLCADDYGISPGVNRAIRDLIKRGRLNATSVMVVGPAIGRDEVAALQDVVAERNARGNRCAIGLHVTLTAPFRPLTMH